MEWYKNDIRFVLMTARRISHGIATNIINSVFTRSRNIRENIDAWPCRLRHKLYKRLQNKFDNDWPCLNDDIAKFICRILCIKWKKNCNLYYLRSINFFKDYVYI